MNDEPGDADEPSENVANQTVTDVLLTEDVYALERILEHLTPERFAVLTDELRDSLLAELSDAAHLMGENGTRVVDCLIALPWDICDEHQGASGMKGIDERLPDLLTQITLGADGFHMKTIINAFVTKFKPVLLRRDSKEYALGEENQRWIWRLCHKAINQIAATGHPWIESLLTESIVVNFPWSGRGIQSDLFSGYIMNVLFISFQAEVTEYIKMVNKTVRATTSKRSNNDSGFVNNDGMSSELMMGGDSEPMVRALDDCLQYILIRIYTQAQESRVQLLSLYHELLEPFGQKVLNWPEVSHVPFIWFYMCSLDEEICDNFMEWLWAETQGEILIIQGVRRKHAAVSYLADLIARAEFISAERGRKWLSRWSEWCVAYLEYSRSRGSKNCEGTILHGMFYAVTQAVFFVISFRYKDLIRNKAHLDYMRSLQLDRITHSAPNPLRYCSPQVALAFVNITRRYQLAWCNEYLQSVGKFGFRSGTINGGSNNPFTPIFPFDPIQLPKSRKFFPSQTYRMNGGGLTEILSAADDRQQQQKQQELAAPDSALLCDTGENRIPIPSTSANGERKPRTRNISSRISFCDDSDLTGIISTAATVSMANVFYQSDFTTYSSSPPGFKNSLIEAMET